MDLGIRGKTALVCAASKGLGRGCAFSLAREGVNLVVTARGGSQLHATRSPPGKPSVVIAPSSVVSGAAASARGPAAVPVVGVARPGA